MSFMSEIEGRTEQLERCLAAEKIGYHHYRAAARKRRRLARTEAYAKSAARVRAMMAGIIRRIPQSANTSSETLANAV